MARAGACMALGLAAGYSSCWARIVFIDGWLLRMASVSFFHLGLRSLWRDLRAGELRLLLVAVTLAVAALSAVAFFSQRLNAALHRDAAQLLGGDLVVSSDHVLPERFMEQAQALHLQAAQTQTFPTMARAPQEAGGAARLVTLKAVSNAYPLRGVVRVSDASHWQPGDADFPARQAVQAGQVWVEAPLLEALRLQVGGTLLLGDSAFRIAHVLTQEPDRGGELIGFAPRVLMHADDLAATGLVQPASRVTYRLALTGDAAAVEQYADWTRAQLVQPDMRGARLETLEDNNPRMQETLGRAANFLNLVALLAALLSAVAIALATRSFALRHLDDCAMLRVLGLRQRTIALSYAVEFLLVGLAGSMVGLLIGFGMHYLFIALLGDLLRMDLPAPGWQAVILGLGAGVTLLAAFGLPPVLQMADTPALRVIRRELGRVKPASAVAVLAGVAGFAALLFATTTDWKLGAIAVSGFMAAVALFMAWGWCAVWLVHRITQTAWSQRLPQGMRLALRQLGARPAFTVVQVSSLSIGLMALVLLALLRTDLIRSWRQATPPDANNRYVINILPGQEEAFQDMLKAAGVARFDWYPMVRGRLVAINGKPVAAEQYSEERTKRLVQREFNLSFSAQQPPWNILSQGMWQTADARGISMEEGIMQTLGLRLGDKVMFDMGGMQRESAITSVRKVNWASMHVNFFAMYPVADLGDEAAVTYITAYRSPARVSGQESLDYRLVQTFPNITQIDMDNALHQVQTVLGRVIGAVELLFVFGLAAGLLVLVTTVAMSREERAHEFAIMRALGGRRHLLRRVQNAELLAVGALAGLLAGAAALAMGYALARHVFEFEWTLAWWMLPASALVGALLAWAAGWWSLHGLLQRPVMQTLRLENG